MKRWLIIFLVIVTVTVTGGAYFWWQEQIKPVGPSSEVSFVIPKNQIAALTVQQLQDQHLIRSALAAKIYLKATRLDQKIQNGTFVVNPSGNMVQVLETLTHPPKDVWVTIPEGWRREQIADRFAAELAGAGAVFSKDEFLVQTKDLEGRLFPDTYLVPRDMEANRVVKLLTDTFASKIGEIDKNTLILASLVEREGKTDTDRPVIAGILQNRLQAGWPLQVDASVQYAKGDWQPITDTKFPSIYNTYIHAGLPPTPICNPGLAAINAARSPEKTPYWYYIHGQDGAVHYAASLSEHNANIDKYLNP